MERTDFEQWKSKEVARLLALVETERRYYQEMVAAIPVGMAVLSSSGDILWANRSFRQTFRLRSEDLRRRTFDQILPSAMLKEKIADVLATGNPQLNLFLDLPSEGESRQLRIAVMPIRDWDDETEVEALVMVEDLSGIDRLRAGGAPLTAVAEAPATPIAPSEPSLPAPADLPVAVWVVDPAAWRFLSVQGAAEEILGYPISYWLEAPEFWSERIHPGDRGTTLEFYRTIAGQPGDHSVEFRALTSEGQVIWCRETVRVPALGVEPRRLAGVLANITERKQLDEQMLQSQRIEALEGLAARLTHDLNNPLMIITGYAEEILNALRPEDPVRGDMQEIFKATERIAAVTGQLLAFTRRRAAAPQAVELAKFLGEIEDRIHQAAGEQVAVEILPGETTDWVAADPEQLAEVMLALVSGGREDARERTRVRVRHAPETIREDRRASGSTLNPGTYIKLVIEDDGHGMEPQQRAAVFEQFLGPKDPERAAGPMLAQAYHTVRECGGDIRVSSEPYRGVSFSVYLPVAEPAPATEQEAPPAAEAEPVPEAEPAPEAILVVEDEAGIRALMRKILNRQGYHVLEAASGGEALGLAQSYAGRVRLLITDIVMPEMSGRELAAQLSEKTPDLPVLYISGYSGEAAIDSGQLPAGVEFLQKPFTLGSLVNRVQSMLEEKP